ncbi:hypothetical protein [Deinococcus peraridilitoris]|uniref:Uncharacterized protein n=1 Tax=Deinococcus peraridilitoris (strain DSM 19664 / LMG 22246 / CIP 109416 / KR-200) TaxID=937777 RepID=L0A176_DEIPD|nr:hypothetical protein [Deinococcus peraridilitoris]AFZ67628.1 hypothetical protein Deipe_2138 [Deinococcus peraridilitoris DSM 19664]
MNDDQKGGAHRTDRIEGVDVQNAESGVPDRSDTGGGPRGGNTVDGRTGPGLSGAQGAPESSLRAETNDLSGDGNLGSAGQGDDLRPLGGWSDDLDQASTSEKNRES